MKVKITMTGTAPLLMHNIRTANPLDPIARQMKAISSKRIKTDEDHMALARLEFEGGLYYDPTLGPYLPGANVERSLVEGARITKAGKKVERGLFVIDNEVPVLYDGPRDIATLVEDENYRSVLPVRVGTSRVMRTRPLFREWTLKAEAELDPSVLSLEELTSIAESTGAMVGLGDFRPRYGRFDAKVQQVK